MSIRQKESTAMAQFVLPHGTVCTRHGIPFELAEDTRIRCHPANWAAIREEFCAEADYGKLPESQEAQVPAKPCQAEDDA